MSVRVEDHRAVSRVPAGYEEGVAVAPSVAIDVCGRFRLVVAGERRDGAIHQQGRLALAFLAIHRARPVSRDELELAIWGEGSSRGHGAALSTILSRLRRALGPGVIQSHSRACVQLAEHVVVDYHNAFALFAQAQDALRHGNPEEAAGAADRSLQIAHGGLLHGESASWLEDLRRELTELGLRARECIAEAALLRGGPELGTAADRAREIIRAEPLRESAHAVLMRALEAQGNVAQALAVYEELRERLSDELGVTPGAQLRALHSRLLGAPQAAPAEPPAAAKATPSPLPLSLARVRAPFVGRETELNALRELFGAPGSGSCRLALLEGEPGIGKTRLSVQFAQDCQRNGAVTLYGRCDPETVVPYQPFLEALRGALGAGVLAPLRQRIPGHLAELARVLPELADTAGVIVPTLGADDSAERYRLFDAVATVLAEVARAQPMLLILDDLHWADKATLLMLRQVIRSAGDAPMLVLGTYRDTERCEPLLDALADLHREHVLHRISLTGLDEGNATQLIGQISDGVSSQLSRTLWEECRGNPFFLEEMLRHESSVGRAEGGSDALPHAIADVIGRRLARVSPDARMILEIACVAGNRFSIEIVERLGELSEDVLDTVLCEAIDAHLIEEVPGVYGRFSFEHALIRQTLYEQLTRTRRARLHLRVAQVLEEQSTDDASRLAELAHHYLQAPPSQGQAKAGHYAVLAARHALEVLAFEEAVRHYEAALSLLVDEADAEQRHELLLALGDAHFKAGDARGARLAFREAGDIAREIGSATGFAKAALGSAQIFALIIDEEMVALLEEALQWLGDGDPSLQSRLLSRLVTELSLARDSARVSTLSEHALAVARRTGDRGALSAALSARRWSLRTPESIGERQQISTEFLRLAASAGSDRLAIQGHQWHLMDLFELGDIDGADAALEVYSSLAQERRLPAELYWMWIYRAARLLLAGRYEEAEEHSRAAFELGTRIDPNADLAFTLQMVTIRRDRGGLEEFEDDVRAKVEQYPAIPGWRCVLAHMLCELGRLDDARQELDAVSANAFDVLPRDALWLGAIAYCAEVAARLEVHAEALYELLRPFPDRNVVVGWTASCLGSSSRPLALLAATLGRRDDAIVHFQDALAMNERMGAAAWLARTRVEYAEFLLRSGHDPDAVTLLEQGLAGARELGMPALVEQATGLLERPAAR